MFFSKGTEHHLNFLPRIILCSKTAQRHQWPQLRNGTLLRLGPNAFALGYLMALRPTAPLCHVFMFLILVLCATFDEEQPTNAIPRVNSTIADRRLSTGERLFPSLTHFLARPSLTSPPLVSTTTTTTITNTTMCQPSIPHSNRRRSLVDLSSVGPATLALEQSNKRRRVSDEKEDVDAAPSTTSSVGAADSLDDLFASLAESNEEEQFPTIAWDFDDDDDDE